MLLLFVVVVTVCSEDENYHFIFEDAVNQSMLLCNLSAPSTFRLAFQRLRMTCPCLGMLSQLLNETLNLGKSLWFVSFQFR